MGRGGDEISGAAAETISCAERGLRQAIEANCRVHETRKLRAEQRERERDHEFADLLSGGLFSRKAAGAARNLQQSAVEEHEEGLAAMRDILQGGFFAGVLHYQGERYTGTLYGVAYVEGIRQQGFAAIGRDLYCDGVPFTGHWEGVDFIDGRPAGIVAMPRAFYLIDPMAEGRSARG